MSSDDGDLPDEDAMRVTLRDSRSMAVFLAACLYLNTEVVARPTSGGVMGHLQWIISRRSWRIGNKRDKIRKVCRNRSEEIHSGYPSR